MDSIQIKFKDTNGFIMKLLFCAIMWYKEVLQYRFFHFEYFFVLLGGMLTLFIAIDYSRYLSNNVTFRFPKPAVLMSLYVILTYLFGIVVSPVDFYHRKYGTIVIEFTLIMIFLCYFCITRKTYEFIIWNYIFIYIFMLAVFLIAPESVKLGGGLRYSFSKDLNPNSFAVGLSTGIWSILYMISRRKIKFILGISVCGTMLYAIFLSGSRKGFIGSILCISLWFLMYYIPLRGKNSRLSLFLKIVIVIFTIALMFFLLMPFFTTSSVGTRMKYIFSDESYLSRLDMYKYGFKLIKESPVFGYGFWGFANFYGLYSHSTVVEVLVSSGVPISILYFAAYIIIYKNLFIINKICKRNNLKDLIAARHFLIMFIMIFIYTVCVIHIYDLFTFINFGMIMTFNALENRKLKNL